MKKRLSLVLVAALVAASLLTGCQGDSSGAPQEVATSASSESETKDSSNEAADTASFSLNYASGATGGCFYPVSAAMAEFLPGKVSGLTSITVTPGTGQSNIQATQDGEVDIAFAKLPGTIQAINGLPPFEGVCDQVANLMYFYNESFHFVVLADAGIDSVADMKGHSLATQTTGNQAEQMTREVLDAYGLTYDDLSNLTQVNDYNDSIELMKNGQVEAFTFANAVPVTVLTDLANVRDIKLLSITGEELEKVLACNDGYVASTIPGGTYKNVDEDVSSFGGAIHVICNKSMDENTAYEIVKYTCENLETIRACHATFTNLTVEQMGQPLPLEFHPGAEKYYKEVGVIK